MREVVDSFLKPGLVEGRKTISLEESLPGTVERASEERQTSIVLVGASFKTSSIAYRERLAAVLSRDSLELRRLVGAREYAELVTCNRVEIAMATESFSKGPLSDWLSRIPGSIPGSFYVLRDSAAVAHLFRVAAGLDSLVLGEEQILTQVREAADIARSSRSSLGLLSPLFDAAINAAKRIRAEVKPANRSVSSIALDFALSRLPSSPRSVLLIGTGNTARLAASQMGQAKLYVATKRSSIPLFPRATVIGHSELRAAAQRSDLIISATRHRGYLLRKGDITSGRRRVVLDLGFPRNIDPALATGKTEVFNLDDMASILSSRQSALGPQANLADQLVAAEAEGFSRWLLASKQSTALSRVYLWAEETRQKETEAALSKLSNLSPRDKKVVRTLSKRLLSKFLAPPTDFAKSSSPDFPQEQRLEVIQRVFGRGKDKP